MSNNTSELHGPPPDFSGYAFFTIGLFTGVLFLLAFFTLLLYFCFCRIAIHTSRLSQGNNASFPLQTISIGNSASTESPRVGLDDATLKSYPVLLYSEAKRDRKGDWRGDSAAACPICLGDYRDSEWLRELPDCGHLFHQKCIDMWLKMNSSCPLCRTSPLPTPASTPLAEVAPLARSGA